MREYRNIKFKILNGPCNGAKLNYMRDGIYSTGAGGNFSLYLKDSYMSLELDTRSGKICSFGGVCALNGAIGSSLSFPRESIDAVISVEQSEKLQSECACRIHFKTLKLYDSMKGILQIGMIAAGQKFYRILENAYVQLDCDGHLKGILITDIFLTNPASDVIINPV